MYPHMADKTARVMRLTPIESQETAETLYEQSLLRQTKLLSLIVMPSFPMQAVAYFPCHDA
jgi:hypothetical protein